MAFSKIISFNSQFTQQIFNEAHGALWAVNGRLSGFHPSPTSEAATITSVSVSGGTNRTISLTLIPPGTADDLRFPPAGQTTSFCLANGVLLKSDAVVPVSITFFDTLTLGDQNRIVIYAQYDGTSAVPQFLAARESVLDASPTTVAKLAVFDPDSRTWEAAAQVSFGGLFKEVQAALRLFGGFFVTEETSTTLAISPGTIIGSFGRIINGTIQLAAVPTLPVTAGDKRKDLVVVVDPYDEENTSPTILVLRGKEEGPLITISSAGPRPTAANQVPIAEILVQNTTGIIQVVDIRPVQAWQTDVMSQALPQAFGQLLVNCVQPGFALTDTTQDANQTWSVSVFRSLSPSGPPDGSKLVFGITGGLTNRSFIGPSSFGPFVPHLVTQFPPTPYILGSSFQVISQPGTVNERNVTDDPAYAIVFDYQDGVFVGMTSTINNEVFRVNYQQVSALFAIDDDGTVNLPALDLLYAHLAPANPAAHTASNIAYNNAAGPIPGVSPPSVSTQTAIAALAAAASAPAAAAPFVLQISAEHDITLAIATLGYGISQFCGIITPSRTFTITEIGATVGIFKTPFAVGGPGSSAVLHFIVNPTDVTASATPPVFEPEDSFAVPVTLGLAPGSGSDKFSGRANLVLTTPVVLPPGSWLYMWMELPSNTSTDSGVSVRVNANLLGTLAL